MVIQSRIILKSRLREQCARLDRSLYPCYTEYMKTAISLPDSLFDKAERTAQYMGISRSRLFAIALEDYINRYNGEMTTQKLNEVYEKINKDEFSQYLDVGLESLRNLTKDDTW